MGDFVILCVVVGSFFWFVGGWIFDCVGGIKVFFVLFVIVVLCMVGVSSLLFFLMVIVFLFVGMMGFGMGNGVVF